MSLTPKILCGLPKDTKATGGQRVDFKLNPIDQFIYTKGQRFWWSRAAMCPCRANEETDSPDYNCTLCGGKGWWYFMPQIGLNEEDTDVAGNPIEINEARDAVGVHMLITSTTQDPQIYEKFGTWYFGTARMTAQSPNRIGYRDAFIARDSEMWAGQLITADGADEILVVGEKSNAGLWSAATSVTLLRSVARVYEQGTDFELTKDGTIRWLGTPPESGTVLSYYGAFHPRWVVVEFPYAYRDTMISKKRETPKIADQFQQLPMAAMVKLDFLA